MSDEDKVVKVNNTLYERAKQIAEAKGIKIGDAIVEASEGLTPSVSICEEAGFKDELRKMGVTPPTEVKWLFGFLDNFTPEMLKGSRLAPYAEARAKAKAVCSLLPGAEEVIKGLGLVTNDSATEQASEPTQQSEPAAELEATEAPEAETTTPEAEAAPAEPAEIG